jgi:hypothetical protein
MRSRSLLATLATAAIVVPGAVATAPPGSTPSPDLSPIPTPDLVGSAGTTPARPVARLRIVDYTPLTLRGTGFRSHELVRVVVDLGRRSLAREQRAGARGGFTARFVELSLDPCGTPPSISARGVRTGLVASMGLPRDCAMP